MAKTILVCGYGPAISSAIADTFGARGFSVGLVARTAQRLEEGVARLRAKDIRAEAFVGDLSNPDVARDVVRRARAKLGPIDVLQWTAAAYGAGDLFTVTTEELRTTVDVAVSSLVAAVQEALPDLRATKGSIMVTNGGLGLSDPAMEEVAARFNLAGLSIANAAKHKLVGVLAKKLAPEGIYVGEVLVLGTVKGSAWDHGDGKIEPSAVAAKFWELHEQRKETSAQVLGG